MNYHDPLHRFVFAIPRGWSLTLTPRDDFADRFYHLRLADPESSAVIEVKLLHRLAWYTLARTAVYLPELLERKGYRVEVPGVGDGRIGALPATRVAFSHMHESGELFVGQFLFGLIWGASLEIEAVAQSGHQDVLNAARESFLASWEIAEADQGGGSGRITRT